MHSEAIQNMLGAKMAVAFTKVCLMLLLMENQPVFEMVSCSSNFNEREAFHCKPCWF